MFVYIFIHQNFNFTELIKALIGLAIPKSSANTLSVQNLACTKFGEFGEFW